MKINRKELLEALAKLVSVVERKPVTPILSHVLATKTKTGLALAATDTRSGMTIQLGAESPIDFCAPAVDLLSIIAGLDCETVAIKTTERRLIIEGGTAKFSLATEQPEFFPKMDAAPMDKAISVQVATLAEALESVAYAAASDAVRPHLNAISIVSVDGGATDFFATDGHRMALRKVRDVPQLGRDAMISLPSAIAVMKVLGEDGDCMVGASADVFAVTAGSVTFTTKLVPATVLPYRTAIPAPSTDPAVVDKLRFLAALKRALLVRAAGKETDQQGDLVCSVGQVAISRENTDSRSDETVTCDGGHEGNVRCNLRYLHEAMASFPDGDVELHSGEWNDPIVIREKTGTQVAIIAPARK